MVIPKAQRTNVTYVLFGFSVLISLIFFFAIGRWPEEMFLAYSYAVTALFLGAALVSQMRFRQLLFLKTISVCVLLVPSLLIWF